MPDKEPEIVFYHNDVFSLRNCIPLLSSASLAEELVLYEGLPHPREKQDFRAELRKEIIWFDDQPFYPEPRVLSHSKNQALVKLLNEPANFEGSAWDGKACGGFHADYCLEWTTPETGRLYCLLCFGCGDLRLFQGENVIRTERPTENLKLKSERKRVEDGDFMRCEFVPGRDVQLWQVLIQHRKHRPLTQFLQEKIDSYNTAKSRSD